MDIGKLFNFDRKALTLTRYDIPVFVINMPTEYEQKAEVKIAKKDITVNIATPKSIYFLETISLNIF